MFTLKEKRVQTPVVKKKNRYTNLQVLKQSEITPYCNTCPFRAVQEGGNGVCEKYEKDAMCVIRKDIKKAVTNYNTRDPTEILELIIADFESNFEDIRFLTAIERMSGELNPEVTRRQKIHIDLARLVNELSNKRAKIEVEEKTISDDTKTQISKIIRMEQENSES